MPTPEIILMVTSCLIFAVIGVLLFILPGRLSEKSMQRKTAACDGYASGRVIEMREEHHRSANGHHRTTYRPVVEFQYNGDTITFTHNFGCNPPAYSTGESIHVRFETKEPETGIHILPKDAAALKTMATICRIIGFFFVLTAIISAIFPIWLSIM